MNRKRWRFFLSKSKWRKNDRVVIEKYYKSIELLFIFTSFWRYFDVIVIFYSTWVVIACRTLALAEERKSLNCEMIPVIFICIRCNNIVLAYTGKYSVANARFFFSGLRLLNNNNYVTNVIVSTVNYLTELFSTVSHGKQYREVTEWGFHNLK